MITLSIDPGIRGCGCALWDSGKLVAAAYVKNSDEVCAVPRQCANMADKIAVWTLGIVHPAMQLVLEWPQTYGGRSSRGDANDLFPLAGIDGALAAIFPAANITHYVPHAWKGSLEKPSKTSEPYSVESRVRDRLSTEEAANVKWPTNVKLSWDVTDAIGVGLKFHGRFERKRVFHRE